MSGDGNTGKVRVTGRVTPTTVKPSCVCTVLQRQTAIAVGVGHRRTVEYCTHRQIKHGALLLITRAVLTGCSS